MKRKKMRKLILSILSIIVIVIAIILILNGKTEDKKRLYSLYENLNSSQTYLFEMEQDESNKTIMAKKGDKTIIDSYSDNDHTTTIIKDNNTYLILHDREEYYVYEQNNIEQAILTDGLAEVAEKEFSTGTEKIKGKKYFYEEFSGITMFVQTSWLGSSEEDIKTRFYFDSNDNLVYIRTIKGVNHELLTINVKNEVNDSIFEIPSHYAEN